MPETLIIWSYSSLTSEQALRPSHSMTHNMQGLAVSATSKWLKDTSQHQRVHADGWREARRNSMGRRNGEEMGSISATAVHADIKTPFLASVPWLMFTWTCATCNAGARLYSPGTLAWAYPKSREQIFPYTEEVARCQHPPPSGFSRCHINTSVSLHGELHWVGLLRHAIFKDRLTLGTLGQFYVPGLLDLFNMP